MLIAKRRKQAEGKGLSTYFYHKLLQVIDYGYNPWKAMWPALAFILLGCGVFAFANNRGLFWEVENKSCEYAFSAIMYSVDCFVPLIDLQQARFWLPASERGNLVLAKARITSGGLVRAYLWFHILSGWTLSTLVAGGVAGIIQ